MKLVRGKDKLKIDSITYSLYHGYEFNTCNNVYDNNMGDYVACVCKSDEDTFDILEKVFGIDKTDSILAEAHENYEIRNGKCKIWKKTKLPKAIYLD
jgi:hypothetical protein